MIIKVGEQNWDVYLLDAEGEQYEIDVTPDEHRFLMNAENTFKKAQDFIDKKTIQFINRRAKECK